LQLLEGNNIPDISWKSSFNITKIGPSTAKIRVMVNLSYPITPIWNVIATIPGEIEPDRMIIIGAHRDAWTYGAVDPIDSTAILLEISRSFSELLKKGWKPRTLVICSWDAEEYGLIGSVEFVETHYPTLFSKAVVYFNLDATVSGIDSFTSLGSPSFKNIIEKLTKSIMFNEKINLFDKWDKKMYFLGSGSDFSPFIHHTGIASLHLSLFPNDNRYESVYHSNYDSPYWIEYFGDPTFEGHVAMTKIYGELNYSIKLF
jgi:N-acetylated-alpha-linked acidic dipeptidase